MIFGVPFGTSFCVFFGVRFYVTFRTPGQQPKVLQQRGGSPTDSVPHNPDFEYKRLALSRGGSERLAGSRMFGDG